MADAPAKRCFVAIELDDATRHDLAETMVALKQVDGLRLTAVENLHITLKFLGDVADARIGDVTAALEMAVEGISPFSLELAGVDYLPDERRPRVLAAAFDRPTMLGLLVEQIETMLAEAGFAEEARAYRPHCTLGRFRRPPRGPLPRPRLPEGVGLLVRSIALIESDLQPRGPVHAAMGRFALGG